MGIRFHCDICDVELYGKWNEPIKCAIGSDEFYSSVEIKIARDGTLCKKCIFKVIKEGKHTQAGNPV
jgi:hypothetical protein